jgi:hypothetical protein
MKRDIAGFLLFIAIAVGLFIVYALFMSGMNLNNAMGSHQSDLSSMSSDAFRYLMDNKIAVIVILGVLVLAKVLAGSPGPVKS